MSQPSNGEAEFLAAAQAMHKRLVEWRAAHPAASFDEIANEVRGERQALMGQLLAGLAQQHGVGELLVERNCAQCGQLLHYKGEKGRTVLHPEGQPRLERGYHHCDHCGHAFFPSG